MNVRCLDGLEDTTPYTCTVLFRTLFRFVITVEWIQCQLQACLDWAHIGCARLSANDMHFVCERCVD